MANERKSVPTPPEAGAASRNLRRDGLAGIRNVSFRVGVRGYDRDEVDAYVKRVNRAIAELEVGSSPRAAVRHALDRVGEQVHGILERAREAAEEIMTSAREEADEFTARAKAEAADLVVSASTEADASRAEAAEIVAQATARADEILDRSRAEAEGILAHARAEVTEQLQRLEEEAKARREEAQARLREIHADIATVSEEHRGLLGDIHDLAARLEQVAGEAGGRAAAFVPLEPTHDVEENRSEASVESLE